MGLMLGVVILLVGAIAVKGTPGFFQTRLALDVVGGSNGREVIRTALAARFPDAVSREDQRALRNLLSIGAEEEVLRLPEGTAAKLWLTADDTVDMTVKGVFSRTPGTPGAKLNARQLGWIAQWEQSGDLALRFNGRFFTAGDSREPELAGIGAAAMGSLYTLAVTLLVCFPLGVAAAVYLEELAPHNRFTAFVEININNLAAVPSGVFGLLGLALFLNVLHVPRSTPLAGGLVLALVCLPTVILAARTALKAVPPSLREAALAMGATRLQVVGHHVLPLAMPGIFTGIILAMAHALGETAPLLMIGMVAFIADVPQGLLDSSAVLPVQIYLWADSPERAFAEKTSAAILVLLAFLAVMNLTAILLRRKFERKW